MKLKEAQTLGILALVAVAAVMICIWGGDDVPNEGALIDADGQMLGSADLQPGISELLEELMPDNPPAASIVEPELPETDMVLGGGPPPAPSEESAISILIEQFPPEDIPLSPVRREASPGRTQPPAMRSVPPKAIYHVVQKGDTLTDISREYYGTIRFYKRIQQANAALVPDEDNLPLGARLVIPPLDAAQARKAISATVPKPDLSASSPKRTYKVQKNDSLWRIAVKCYGDGMKYKDIQAANKLPDANSVDEGTVLVIP